MPRWGRTAGAILVRLLHYCLGARGLREALLFADDELMAAGDQAGIEALGLGVFLLQALGAPWSWRKFRGGRSTEWVGFAVDFARYRLGISAKRAAWIRTWCSRQLEAGKLAPDDLLAVLGRLSFSSGALEHVRPFLSPLYSWGARVAASCSGGRVRVPWSVRFLLRMLIDLFGEEGRMLEILAPAADLGEAFRADAKAQGSQVILGGWECLGGTPPSRARWFQVALDRRNAP